MFSNDNKNKNFDPLKHLEIAMAYRTRQNQKESCQLCGDIKNEYLSQLWIEDLPFVRACADCIAMIQRLVIETRKQKFEIKKIGSSDD